MCVCCPAAAFLARQCFSWWVFQHCMAWRIQSSCQLGVGFVCVCVGGGITQSKLLLLPLLLLLLLLLLVVLCVGYGVYGWIDEWVLE